MIPLDCPGATQFTEENISKRKFLGQLAAASVAAICRRNSLRHWRSCLDTRRSVVFYDQNFMFNYALDRLPRERVLRKLYQQTTVRYWSRGV